MGYTFFFAAQSRRTLDVAQFHGGNYSEIVSTIFALNSKMRSLKLYSPNSVLATYIVCVHIYCYLKRASHIIMPWICRFLIKGSAC